LTSAIRWSTIPELPGNPGCPSSSCGCRRSRANYSRSNAPAAQIQRLDAIKLYGPHAVWEDVGQRLLDDGCQFRTGRHEEDGCWPGWAG
jgi:hypothetical protein